MDVAASGILDVTARVATCIRDGHRLRRSVSRAGVRGPVSTATLLCILLLLAGCSPRSGTESPQDRERYDGLQAGVSTRQDVYQRFGQPVEILPVEGGSTWLYALTAVPTGDLLTGGKTVVLTLATFDFDDRGIYQRVNTSRDRRARPRGSGTGGTPLGDTAAAHVREEMQRLGLPFDEALWDASARAHRLWTQPLAAPE